MILNVTAFFNNNILIPRKWTLNIDNLHILSLQIFHITTFILNSPQSVISALTVRAKPDWSLEA